MNQIVLKENSSFYYRFFRLALINMISTIMVPLAGLVSVAFLGHLSEIHHLAGVALAANIFNCIYFTFEFLRMSTSGVTAQSVGRGDREKTLQVLLRNTLIALGLSLLVLLLQYPFRELGLVMLEGSSQAKAAGIDYFNARIWGAPAVLANFVLIGWFIGREESGKVLVISAVGNLANILLDYLTIVRWNWASTGAGLSQALSQYLMLLVGLIFCCLVIDWQDLKAAVQKTWDFSAFKSTFTLNGNVFLYILGEVFVLCLFYELSGAMGAMTLTENALMDQIILLGCFANDGIGLATEALAGNFKGQGKIDSLLLLIKVALISSLLMLFTFSAVTALFSQTVFGLLTDHAEVTKTIYNYLNWLFVVLMFAAISYLLKGYFIGLTEGKVLRKAGLVSMLLGFTPIFIAAWYFNSNHLLWLALSMFFIIRTIMFAIEVPRTLRV